MINGVIGGLVGAGYVAIIAVAIAVGNNPHTVDNLDWAKVQTGQQQPGVTFDQGIGGEQILIRLTRAFDPGDEYLRIIQPSPDERIVVVVWSVVNSSGNRSALVTGDAASLKVEHEGDDGKLKTETIGAVVIGVNNLAAPAQIPARGAATINAAFVIPADAVPLELRFRRGFAGTGGIKYVFD